MATELIIFSILAIIAITCGVLVIKLNKVSHRVVNMVFVFFAVAGLYFLLRAEFIGIIQIMVYVGALSILFLFGMMMTDHKTIQLDSERTFTFKFFSKLGIAALLVFMLRGVFSLKPGIPPEHYIATAEAIGKEVYGDYVIAFQAAGVLLLAALVGAVVLARKEADE